MECMARQSIQHCTCALYCKSFLFSFAKIGNFSCMERAANRKNVRLFCFICCGGIQQLSGPEEVGRGDGKYSGWNGSTVEISCWADLAQPLAEIKKTAHKTQATSFPLFSLNLKQKLPVLTVLISFFLNQSILMYIRGFTKFGIKVL